jgi:hypothetical protein
MDQRIPIYGKTIHQTSLYELQSLPIRFYRPSLA